MTLPASIALLSAGIACFVAAMCWLFSRAPGWHDQRYFALAAVAVAIYAALNLPTTAPIGSDAAVVICSRLQIAAGALHTAAWVRYTNVLLGKQRSSVDRVIQLVLAVMSIVGVFTPLLVPDIVRTNTYVPFHVSYRSPQMSAAGDVTWAAVLGLLVVPLFRLGRAFLRGMPNAGIQFAALCFLMTMGVNDALVVSGFYDAPYVVDVAFLVPVAAVGYSLAVRFVADARALNSLRNDLEHQVADRTAELGRAYDALHRAEKLAALGQFAAGVAHEVNNPSAVVSANLQYLSEAEAEALSNSGRDAIRESIESVQRISAIVRQLLDAGRLAATPEPARGVPLRSLGESALAMARARMGRRVTVSNVLPENVYVSGQESVLVQVLVNLVVNAIQAIPDHSPNGIVVLRADQVKDRVLLMVEDNGAGMEPEVLHRVFEPFFTTKPFGSGTGLGLAVSRGLVMSLGGDLRLESRPGAGTRAIIELARAEPPALLEARGAVQRSTGPMLRLLLVDDEPGVLSSARRLLESRYHVEVASGVEDGLRRIEAEGGYDIVLCDVMMPAGGGERLYNTLLGLHPSVARRIVFLTGGAVTEGARRFLHAQPQPVLHKPIDLRELADAAKSVTGSIPQNLH